jgi:hypothetical protein
MPQQPPFKIVVDTSLAEILAERHARRNAETIAAGLPPIEEFPFISSAEVEKEKQRDAARERPARTRLTHAAKVKIAARCDSDPAFERHSRKCQLCRHPDVDRIEDFFVNWSSASAICKAFKITGVDAVYRHARATGLDVARRQNARFAVEKLIEEVDHVTVTSSTVLRAVRALSRLDDNGHWTDPPSTHIVLTAKDLPAQTTMTEAPRSAVAGASAEAVPRRAEALAEAANRLTYEELEIDVSRTKQEVDPDSNR